MNTLAFKDARIEQKTTKEVKDFLNKAAILNGMDLSSFMIASAMERARSILQDHNSIALSTEAQLKLVQILQSPQQATEAMKELRNLPRLEVRE
jgi:uncharacterized protein (DUF1778 family)